MKKIKMEMWNS